MKRWLLNIAAALSLLLFVATLVLWVRSHRYCDVVAWVPADGPLFYLARSSDGRLIVGQTSGLHIDYQSGFAHRVLKPGAMAPNFPNKFLGLGWLRMTFQSIGFNHPDLAGKHCVLVGIPMWMFVLMAAPLPVAWATRGPISALRSRRLKGHCKTCGYDLRATPDRCPECGTVATVVGW